MPVWSAATAAALAVLVGVAHSYLGERLLIGPLLAPEKRSGLLARSDFGRNVLRFAWHITTLAWWGMGAALLAAALAPPEQAVRLAIMALSVTFLLTGIVILIVGRGRHLAWPVFLAIGGLGLYPLL
jgi:hypothetical protein